MTFAEIIGAIVVGFVAWTILSSSVQPDSSIAGKDAITYEPTHFGWVKDKTDGEGTLTIKDRSGSTLGEYVLDDAGVLCESPEQAKSGKVTASFKPDLYAARWWYDVGAFASYDTELRLGVRFSPARIAWGTIAPDIVASESALGLGFSIYPPARSVGTWSHFGLGVWYIHDLDTNDNRLSLGLSTSLR